MSAHIKGLLGTSVFFLVVYVKTNVAGVVRLSAAISVVFGFTDPVSVCLRVIMGILGVRCLVEVLSLQFVNVNSFTYHTYNIPTSNSFSALQDLPGDDSVFYPVDTDTVRPPDAAFQPQVFSSPHSTARGARSSCRTSVRSNKRQSSSQLYRDKKTNLRFAVINANSIKGKQAELASLCEYVRPDIIMMSET